MKKILLPLSLMTLAILPAGCMAKSNNASVANDLSNNITELMESAKRVTDIDESKLKIDKLNDKTDINNDYKLQENNTYKNRTIRKVATNKNSANDGIYQKTTTFNKSNLNNSVYTKYKNSISGQNHVQTSNSTNSINQTDNYISDNGNATTKYSTAEYNPRFANSSQSVALTNYIEKIQDLYTICNDTCAASYDLDSLRNELISTCTNCNNLLNKVKKGEVSLTKEQENTLCEYNNTLQSCINDLNSCKNCSEDVNIINTLKGNFSNNCDTLVAKYLKVLNNLDINGSYCNNAQCTVAEINNYIAGICGENVNNYTSRYKFDSYAIDGNESSFNKKDENIKNNQTANNTAQNQLNKVQNSTLNEQNTESVKQQSSLQNSVNTQNNALSKNNNVNSNANTPSQRLQQIYTQKSQSTAKTQPNNQPSTTKNQGNYSTYPMPRPTVNKQEVQQNNQFTSQNVYGRNNHKQTPIYDTPNRHPLTKDIKSNPNKQPVSSQQAGEVITYNNRYNNSYNATTPSPKTTYNGISSVNTTETKNTDYKTDTRKVYTRPSFTNNQLMFGPKNVRANNNIMTLEEL